MSDKRMAACGPKPYHGNGEITLGLRKEKKKKGRGGDIVGNWQRLGTS